MLAESRAWHIAGFILVLVGVLANPLVFRNLHRLVIDPGYDDSVLVMADRNTVHYNSYGTVNPVIFQRWTKSKSFEKLFPFERWVFANGIRAERVAPGALELTGVLPWRGRYFNAGNTKTVLLSFEFAKSHAATLGSSLLLGHFSYQVVGVMPPGFRFAGAETQVWVPLPADATHLEFVGKLVPGVSRKSAQLELRALAHSSRRYGAGVLELITLKQNRQQDFLLAVSLLKWNFFFVLAIACGTLWRFFRSYPRIISLKEQVYYLGFLLGKTALLLLLFSGFWITFNDSAIQELLIGLNGWGMPIAFWLFLLTAWGVTFWSLRDQQNRCRRCCHPLRMPVHSGQWSSLVLDRPHTEYICPFGHGTLYVPGTRLLDLDSVNWTTNRDMWHELSGNTTSL
jgi:hypothetical protein